MGPLTIEIIDSIRKLRDRAADWDDLWMRSSVENPLAHAEPIALWMDRFAPDAPFQALTVQEGGRIVAALPLLGQRKAKIVSTGINPSNGWSHCGQLLVDWTNPEKPKEYLDALVCGFKKLPFSILWLDEIRFENPEWMLFREILPTRRIASQWLPRYHSATFSLTGTYEDLKATWKKKQISRLTRLFENEIHPKENAFDLIVDREQIMDILPQCFDLESKCWKGTEGGGIIKRGMVEYMTRLTKYFLSRECSRIAVLRQQGEMIVFKYCIQGKSTVYSQKTSYLLEYRGLSPGQILQFLMNRKLNADPTVCHFDFVGESGPHQLIWNSQERITGQIVLPANGIVGKTFYFLYDNVMPIVRKIHAKKQLPSAK